MDGDRDGVLAAARAIRPYLAELVGPETAALDEQIARLLNDSPVNSEALAALLSANEETEWFLREVLADAPYYRPPYAQPQYYRQPSRGIAAPAGDPGPVLAGTVYGCPEGDYSWFSPGVGTPVPLCPTHQVSLSRI